MDEIMIEATLKNMEKVLAFVEERIEDCPPKVQHQIGIVVDEIFSNIARYAYNPSIGGAMVRVAVDEDITLEFEDMGVEYNPLMQDDPDITLSADEREAGGLGLFMVKSLMDSVEYRRVGEKNILTIKKKMPPV